MAAQSTIISFLRHVAGSAGRETFAEVATSAVGVGALATASPAIAGCAVAIFAGYLIFDAAKSVHEDDQQKKDAAYAQTLLEQSIRERRSLELALAGFEKGELPPELPPHYPRTVIRERARELREALEAAKESNAETRASLERIESLNLYVGQCIDENIAGVRDALDRVEEKIDDIAQRLLAQNEQLSSTNAQLVGMLADKDNEIQELRDALHTYSEAKGEAALDRVLQPEGKAELIAYLEAQAEAEEAQAIDHRKQAAESESRSIETRRRAAAVAFLIGEIARAEKNLQRILTFAPNDLDAINSLGHVRRLQGELDEAQRLYECVLKLTSDDSWRAIALNNLAPIEHSRGNISIAEKYLKQSIAIDEKLGNIEGAANSLSNLGIIEQSCNNLDAARDCFERAVAINAQLANPMGVSTALANIGNINLLRGDLDAAENCVEEALVIDEKIANQHGIARHLGALGLIQLTRGDLDSAESYIKRSLALHKKLGRKEGMAINLGNLGAIEEARDEFSTAGVYGKQALAIFEELGNKASIAMAYRNLGVIEYKQGHYPKARQLLTQARDLYNQIGMLHMVEELQSRLDDLPEA